jgi:hypothetical protein
MRGAPRMKAGEGKSGRKTRRSAQRLIRDQVVDCVTAIGADLIIGRAEFFEADNEG